MIEVIQEEAVSLLQKQSEKSVQVIVADPPYGISYHSNRYTKGNPHAPIANDWNFQIAPFLEEAGRVLKDGGVLYLFTRWDVYPLWVNSIMSPLSMKNLIVWVKDNHSSGDLKGDFGNKHEFLMMITKGKHQLRGHRWSNIWEFPRIPSKRMLHPTQKPVELIRRAIEASSDEGDLIIDPFCGSGSTGEAGFFCGRNVILGDVDPAMVQISRKRLGLSLSTEVKTIKPSFPSCPILKVVPPTPSLWGIHPEDLAYILEREVAI